MTEEILNIYPNTKLIRKKSEDAVDDIPNELDFVYIDGNHHYDYVKKDVEMYFPKVRQGGIFGGDNYNNKKHARVREVVDEFFKKKNYQIFSKISSIYPKDSKEYKRSK